MNGAPKLTDRHALGLHRARAQNAPQLFLHQNVADEIQERLIEVNKTFSAPALVGHITPPFINLYPDSPVVADTPELRFSKQHDLILHAFGLHWADDPIGQMVQSRLALIPDGLFLAIMFGGSTLNELRIALAEAEAQLTGGLSPRILPMADIRDLGGLLQRAGFALPVADSQKFNVRYPSLAALVSDLRGMGENNALRDRNRRQAPRTMFKLAENIYRQHFSDSEGYLQATFEVVFLTGWAPAATQQKPLRPGTARTRLSEALGVPEISTGEPTMPKGSGC